MGGGRVIRMNDRSDLIALLNDRRGESVMKAKCSVCLTGVRYAYFIHGVKHWTLCDVCGGRIGRWSINSRKLKRTSRSLQK